MTNKTSRKRILVVDDDEIALKMASVILQSEYEVVTAVSGKIALEKLTHIRHGFIPDLILLDILMPYMDGWETFNKIRHLHLSKNIPIIFLTSVAEIEGHQRAVNLGADDYIVKPYDYQDLIKRIGAAITNKTGKKL
ncbi:hypothetical protein AGMMS49928_26730 [Spirochaetia bacterium]|nr:hypothetical protein AGMMS49928_26730 [Spirochaetia bacterium]